MRTLASLVDALPGHGRRPAVLALYKHAVDEWSCVRLGRQVQYLARCLRRAGVERGEHVALLASNRPEWIVACLAVLRAGGIVVPLDVQLDDRTLGVVLRDARPRFLFTSADTIGRLDRLDLPARPQPFLFDVGPRDSRSWESLLAGTGEVLPEVEPDDVAVLFYTSGTTGPPKGVPLRHAHLVFQLKSLIEMRLVTERDRVLVPLPFHHVYPFVFGMLAPLTMGVPIVMPFALTGPQIIRALRHGKVTVIAGVPRLYRALYSAIEARARSRGRLAAAVFRSSLAVSVEIRRRCGLRVGKLLLAPVHRQFGPDLRLLASGGAALDAELAWKLEGLGWQVAVGYGLTETAPLLTLNRPGATKLDSAGRPLPGVELRIQEGEIQARGPSVFTGYRGLPEKTRDAFTADGWFRTGDLGYLDPDGYLYVTGRASTMIVMESGENVQPENVEAAYEESPVLREVGVLQKERRLVAAIVPDVDEIRRRGEADVEAAVREAVLERSRRLPSHHQLSDYVLTYDALLRTRLGKLRRDKLEERYEQVRRAPAEAPARPVSVEQMSAEDRTLLENRAARVTWEWLARRYSDRRLTPDSSPQFDLGIDSLEWMNITLEIGERANVELDAGALSRIQSVRDLLREVVDASEGRGLPLAAVLENPEEALSETQKRWLEPLPSASALLAWTLHRVHRALARGLFGLQVDGLEHLPGREPFVLAPNHVSYLDAPALAAALSYRQMRRTYWAGAADVVLYNPFLYPFRRLAQVVPIDRQRSVVSAFAFGASVLRRGKNLVWFPEGRLSSDGALQPFKPGIGILLERYPVKVVPAFIEGAREALPPGRRLPRIRRPIRITFGAPFDPRGKPRDRIVSALHDRVALLEASRRRPGDRARAPRKEAEALPP